MTAFVLIIWLYGQSGSALSTALLSVCSYAPYVLLSLFAGALSDRWNKKVTMSVCDSLAAIGTVVLLILFLAAINLTASMYETALSPMLLSRHGGGAETLGMVTMCTGLATLFGSIIAPLLPEPKSRIKVIWWTLFFPMSTENFLLALGRTTAVWCFGTILGWMLIPIMQTNMETVLRLHIPIDMHGRVYAARNSFQFFSIPVGYLSGGILIDKVFEPFAANKASALFRLAFGTGKGTGAAFLFAVLGMARIVICLVFHKNRVL
jgi:predicted MFS family arabinose efflux permease